MAGLAAYVRSYSYIASIITDAYLAMPWLSKQTTQLLRIYTECFLSIQLYVYVRSYIST